uniref:Calponin-homology (CH) domain-containing protein n=1 Tax=Heligmosomoides polygyrus TaxID=6339 RepID=A0A8L8Q309_HELPZ
LLEVIRIPPAVNIPRIMKHPKTIVVGRNPLLLPSVIEELKAICPACPIYDNYSRCSRLPAVGNIANFIEQCAGQPIITANPGVELNLELNEDQLLALFSDAIEVQMCITVKRTSIRKLNKAGFTITTNPYLERIDFPSCVDKSCLQSGVIRGNPSLPKERIDAIRQICTDCIMEYDIPACGLGNVKVSVREIVNACGGKEIIMPAENASLIIDASQVTELELNRMCSKVFYMKACIIMKGTNFKHLRCPNLQEFTHCQPGKPVFEIVGNNMLQEVAIPTNVVFPEGEKVLVVLRNPELPPQAIATLRKICPYCEIVEFFSKCGNVDNIDNIDAFLKQCSGQSIIMGQPGLTLDADLTEAQLNRLFSGAVEVQLCLIVRSSAVERLIFPKLQRWTPCAPGKASITIASNPNLKEVAFPACLREDCITNGVIYNNPLLLQLQIEIIKEFCTNCRLEVYVPACGLGVRKYTVRQFVKACSGKEIIKPLMDSPLIIDARQFTEEEINEMCSRAVYLEACVIMNGTPFNSLRCPHLRQMASCKPGKPVFYLTDNSELEVVEIPTSVTFPKKEKVLVVRRNPKLPMAVIASLKKICTYCDIQYFSSKCIGMSAVNDVTDFLSRCTGEPMIIGEPGLVLDAKGLTELQLNKLFANVYHLQMCLVLNGTQIRKLVFPELVKWKSCSHDKPAVAVVDNLQLREFRFPSCRVTGCIESGFVKGNRRLPLAQVKQFGEWCTNCVFETYVPACGIPKARYTAKEFVRACAGKEVIRPRDDYFVTIDSSEVTEDEMNRFCSAAVVMQVCIVISQSSYKKLRCPHLRELIPCKPGRPAITITQNSQFELFYIPQDVEFLQSESIVEIWGNPQMQLEVIESLRRWCPKCNFGDGGGGKVLRHPKQLLNCMLEPRVYDDSELASTCAGSEVIKPQKGFYLRLSSDLVTEAEMNAMCAKAVYMEICITIRGSNYKSLRCSYLREIRPCLPGHAALTVVDNIHLVDLILPKSIVVPEGVNVFEIYENPHISIEVIEWLKTKCEQCKITANLGCDLERRTYTDKEVVNACAGKRIIRPAKGFMLWLKSQTTTEAQINALCAKAVFMEICIDITNSNFKQLNCPYLKELVPCKPGCLLGKQTYSDDELIEACSGKKVIKPAEGFMLTLRKATEEQINALCSEAIFMKICIDISHSNIRNIRCPHLRELQSCLPDRPAIRIVDNDHLRTFAISNTFIHQRGTKLIEIHGNRRLSTRSIETLKQLCPECDIRH